MPYLIGAEQRRDDAEQQQRQEQEIDRMQGEARHGDECNTDLGKFQSPATTALS